MPLYPALSNFNVLFWREFRIFHVSEVILEPTSMRKGTEDIYSMGHITHLAFHLVLVDVLEIILRQLKRGSEQDVERI